MKYDINKVTPRPWMASRYGRIWATGSPYGRGPIPLAHMRGWWHLTGGAACAMSDENAQAIQDANAAHIAHCVNTHEALVEALETVVEQLGATSRDEGEPTCVQGVRAALALARGEENER